MSDEFASRGRMDGGAAAPPYRDARNSAAALSLIFLLAARGVLFADEGQDKVFAQRAHAAFDRARSQYQSDMDNPDRGWKFGRACYDWADWATNKQERATIAREGMAACRQSELFTNCAAAHYYMAMDMGQLARCEMIGGLKLVREMEVEFDAAADLDEHFDFAGAERGLGLLYRDAPGWPISIGSRSKARKFLEKAATLAPEDPENLLNLAESYLKWGERAKANAELDALDALWPKAQKSLTGDAWAQSWDDWSKRRDALREKLSP